MTLALSPPADLCVGGRAFASGRARWPDDVSSRNKRIERVSEFHKVRFRKVKVPCAALKNESNWLGVGGELLAVEIVDNDQHLPDTHLASTSLLPSPS